MKKSKHTANESAQAIERLLEATELTLNTSICLHDFFHKTGVSEKWQRHRSSNCAKYRQGNFPVCNKFDGQKVHRDIANQSNGMIHHCPFGLKEIVVPIICDEVLSGVLFAGSFEFSDSDETAWDSAREILLCVAEKIGRKISSQPDAKDSTATRRRREIMSWMEENIDETLYLEELADRLHLSPSRTGKVINEIFRMSFTELVQSTKLNTAAYWLASGNLSIGEISTRLGYCDQAYFCRMFSRRFGESPTKYRSSAIAKQLGS